MDQLLSSLFVVKATSVVVMLQRNLHIYVRVVTKFVV